MPITAVAGLAFGIAVLSIGFYHITVIGPRLRALGAGRPGDFAGGRAIGNSHAAPAEAAADAEGCFGSSDDSARRDTCRIGFLRFNAFDDVGSDQSFSLALLDRSGDGVVISSIYSREDTRTYGKAVRKYVAQQGASKEEQSAIAMARTGAGI